MILSDDGSTIYRRLPQNEENKVKWFLLFSAFLSEWIEWIIWITDYLQCRVDRCDILMHMLINFYIFILKILNSDKKIKGV